jgi:hypothetical protein
LNWRTEEEWLLGTSHSHPSILILMSDDCEWFNNRAVSLAWGNDLCKEKALGISIVHKWMGDWGEEGMTDRMSQLHHLVQADPGGQADQASHRGQDFL